jgi:hypothetical protein
LRPTTLRAAKTGPAIAKHSAAARAALTTTRPTALRPTASAAIELVAASAFAPIAAPGAAVGSTSLRALFGLRQL